MATDAALRFWRWLDEQQSSRRAPVELRARFRGDATTSTPVTVVVRNGEPLVRLAPETRAVFERIDGAKIVSQHEDPEQGERWRDAFAENRGSDLLTPNAACRLVLGPFHRPDRRIFAFNANVELQVDPRDAARWLDDVDAGDTAWPSVSDLIQRFEDRSNGGADAANPGALVNRHGAPPPVSAPAAPVVNEGVSGTVTSRADANRVALRAVRAVLDAAAPFEVTIEGKRVQVAIERLPPEPWPQGGLSGLNPTTDGALPGAVRAACHWDGGGAVVVVSTGWSTAEDRGVVAVQARVFGKQITWSNVAATIRTAADGSTVPVSGWCALYSQVDETAAPEERIAMSRALKQVVARSGLPPLSPSRIRLFDLEVPTGAVRPSPAEAFRRVVHLTLLKLPFFVREGEDGAVAASLFDGTAISAASTDGDSMPASGLEEKLAGLYPLPGGVRKYKATLDAVLAWLADEPRSLDEFLGILRDRYEVNGPVAAKSYVRLFENLRVVAKRDDDRLELTDAGRAYLDAPEPEALFALLHQAFEGMLETLVITGELGAANPVSTKRILEELLEVDWRSPNQTAFRRNWLLSLGLTERRARGDVLTQLGKKVVAAYAAAAEPLRAEVTAILAMEPDLAVTAEAEEDVAADDAAAETTGQAAPPAPPAAVVPPSWDADRLDLAVDMLDEHLSGLRLPAAVLQQACAALSAGKHLLLVGPPGTGKTELAAALSHAARSEGYCHGPYIATASADWTTFDTIGGYTLKQDSSLAFRSGVFLQALEGWQWLIIDELNRADVDRAFGELMTVLGGRSTDTSYELADGRSVSIGSEGRCSHRLPRTFRVIATMNTWDKTSLFRLSYAVQRRFAIVHVGIPDDPIYAELVDRHGQREGIDPPLEAGAAGPLKELFRRSGLLHHRAIGPAILLDVVRYMRRRGLSGDGLAEAMAMYLLPQLEGLDQDGAAAVFKKLGTALTGWTSPEALATLRERYQEIFPHVKLPEA